MSAFLRIKLLEVLLDDRKPQDPFCAVNMKEPGTAVGPDGARVLQQTKKTFFPDWDHCFDSHLKPGRMMQVVVYDRPGDELLAEVTVETEDLAHECQQEEPGSAVKLALDTRPRGKIIMQVKLYGKSAQQEDTTDFANRTPESLDSLPKNATARRGRRGAVHIKKQDMEMVKGHKFVKKYFRKPIYCSHCHEMMWGFNNQGYQCQVCMYTSHIKCLDSILAKCTGAAQTGTLNMFLKERFKIDVPHRFKPHSFLGPNFCDMCGQMMHGIFRQGLKCEVCGSSCHHRCAKNMPPLCGVNEKLLAEALKEVDQVKKNKRQTSDTSLNGKNQKPLQPVGEEKGEEPNDYQEVTPDMLKATLNNPSPKSPPVVPPRTYTSIRRPSKPVKKFKLEDFQFVKVLGKGSFGKVILSQEVATGKFYALKALKKDVVLEDNDVEATMVEKRILVNGFKHPFLTHVYCTFQSSSHLFFVMEYLNGGDLMFHIQLSHKFKLSRAKFYSAEILSGLQFLHNSGIIYRDLKLDNILLSEEGHCKIADFGMCKENMSPGATTATFCGTPDYIPPEIVQNLRYTYAVDWWSYGVLCYEMITGQSPFCGEDEEELFHAICNAEVPFSRNLDPNTVSFLDKLLQRDPLCRLGCMEATEPIRRHPFFAEIDWGKLEAGQIEPPYKPTVKYAGDASNFDDDFTFLPVQLTPTDTTLVQSIDQANFGGFSYTNEAFISK